MTVTDIRGTQGQKTRQWTLYGGLVDTGGVLGRVVSIVTRPYVATSGIGLAFGLAAMWLGAHPNQFSTVQEAVNQAPEFVQTLVKPWVHTAQLTGAMGKLLTACAVFGGVKANLAMNVVLSGSACASVKNKHDEDRYSSLVLEKHPSDSMLPVLDRRFAKSLEERVPNLLLSSLFAAPFVLLSPFLALAVEAPTIASFFTLKNMASRVLLGDKSSHVKGSWRFALEKPEA